VRDTTTATTVGGRSASDDDGAGIADRTHWAPYNSFRLVDRVVRFWGGGEDGAGRDSALVLRVCMACTNSFGKLEFTLTEEITFLHTTPPLRRIHNPNIAEHAEQESAVRRRAGGTIHICRRPAPRSPVCYRVSASPSAPRHSLPLRFRRAPCRATCRPPGSRGLPWPAPMGRFGPPPP